jgi:hypothetical protein
MAPRVQCRATMPKKYARLTRSLEELKQGKLCGCEACVRDGPHEPVCPVHDEPQGACTCGRTEQAEGAS